MWDYFLECKSSLKCIYLLIKINWCLSNNKKKTFLAQVFLQRKLKYNINTRSAVFCVVAAVRRCLFQNNIIFISSEENLHAEINNMNIWSLLIRHKENYYYEKSLEAKRIVRFAKSVHVLLKIKRFKRIPLWKLAYYCSTLHISLRKLNRYC